MAGGCHSSLQPKATTFEVSVLRQPGNPVKVITVFYSKYIDFRSGNQYLIFRKCKYSELIDYYFGYF